MCKLKMSEYERRRAELIERNKQRLLALGLAHAVREVVADATVQPSSSAAVKKRKKTPASPLGGDGSTNAPRRRSKRLRAKVVGGRDGAQRADKQKEEQQEELLELVDEPRRASTSTNRSGRSWEERMSELELSGLVNCDETAAKFIVLGSTGNPYTVTLSDEKRSCQCVDHRIRKRDCKHIKLILKQLNCTETPSDWFDAVNRMASRLERVGS